VACKLELFVIMAKSLFLLNKQYNTMLDNSYSCVY